MHHRDGAGSLTQFWLRQEFQLSWQPVILALEEEQRSLTGCLHVHNLPDHNRVIAAIVAFADFAFHIAQDAVDDRRAIRAAAPVEIGKFVHAFCREPPGDLLLMFA